MRLAVPMTVALDDLDDAVAKTFERALGTLSRAGALVEHIEVPEFLDVGLINAKGGFSAAESYAWHRYLLTSKGDVYDPRVSVRILRGEHISAADYIDLLNARRSLIARANARLAPYDALVMPTTANTPPRIADLADDKAFTIAEPALASQLYADQHDRRLRDLAAGASRRRGAGRADAGFSRRIGPPHLRVGRGNGGRHPCLISPSPSTTRASRRR